MGFLFIYGVTIWRKTKPKGTRLDKSVADSINVPNATPHAYTTTPSYKYAHSALRNAANLSPILMMVLSTVGAWALVKHRGTDIRIIKDLPSGFQTFDAWKLGMEDLSTYVSKHRTPTHVYIWQ